MAQIVHLPDGSTATFPDEASVDQIKGALAKYHKPSPNPETEKATAATAAIVPVPAPASPASASGMGLPNLQALRMGKVEQQPVEAEIQKPLISAAKLAKGMVMGLPEQAKMIADPFGPDALRQMGLGALQTAGMMKTVQTAPAFSQPWWDAAVPLAAQAVGEVAGVKGSAPALERPPIQGGEVNAGQIASAKSVLEPEVRTRVGEEAPLRQQGEVAQTQAPQDTQAQTVLTQPREGGEVLSEETRTQEGGVPPQQTTDVGQQPGIAQPSTGTPEGTPGGPVQDQGGPGEQGSQTGDKLGSPLNAPLAEEGAAGEISSQPSTGISNERLLQTYGPDAIIAGKGRGAQAWKEIGQADKRDPYAVLSVTQKQGIAAPQDVALFRTEHQRLVNQARNAYGTPEYDELASRAATMANAIKRVAHGPASDVMRALQENDIPRYDSPADFDNIVRERMNRESTPEEQTTFKGISDELRNGDQETIKTATEAQNRLRTYKPKEVISFDEAVNHIKQQIQELTTDCNL